MISAGRVVIPKGGSNCASLWTPSRYANAGCLSLEDARLLLEDSFFETAEVARVASGAAWSSIRDLTLRVMGGGMSYDALIARAALDAGASVLLTRNTKDFLRVAAPGFDIRQPSAFYTAATAGMSDILEFPRFLHG